MNTNASYLKNGSKIPAIVTFIIAGVVKPVSPSLASFLVEVFTDSTASAYSAKREGMTLALLNNIASLKVDAFVIESDVEKITITAKDFETLLPAMVDAMKANKAYRASVESANNLYDESVKVTSKVATSTGTRGRKSTDFAAVTLSLD
jgi:hypothetical protein